MEPAVEFCAECYLWSSIGDEDCPKRCSTVKWYFCVVTFVYSHDNCVIECFIKIKGQRTSEQIVSDTLRNRLKRYNCGQRWIYVLCWLKTRGWGPRVVVSSAVFHARVRGSFSSLGGLKETKMFLPHPLIKLSIAGSLRDWAVVSSASDLQGLNLKSCVWRAVRVISVISPSSADSPGPIQPVCAQKWPKARLI